MSEVVAASAGLTAGFGTFQNVVLSETIQTFDKENGYQVQQTFTGTGVGIINLELAYELLGYKCTRTNDGPEYKLVVIFGNLQDGTAEVPFDKWEIDMDYVQEDVYASHKIRDSIPGTSDVKEDTMSLWRFQIEAARRNFLTPSQASVAHTIDGATTATPGFEDNQLKLYRFVLRGGEAVELKRPILIRRRTISLQYAAREQVNAVETIYTTASLISAFSIPSDVQSQLPTAPGTPPDDTAWSWKMRKHTSEIVRKKQKIHEELEFVFAAWSTLVYNLV